MKPFEILLFGGLGVALVAAVYLMVSAPEGDSDWLRFVEKNHCKAVGSADGSNRGGWRCDDGKIYHRWRQQK